MKVIALGFFSVFKVNFSDSRMFVIQEMWAWFSLVQIRNLEIDKQYIKAAIGHMSW